MYIQLDTSWSNILHNNNYILSMFAPWVPPWLIVWNTSCKVLNFTTYPLVSFYWGCRCQLYNSELCFGFSDRLFLKYDQLCFIEVCVHLYLSSHSHPSCVLSSKSSIQPQPIRDQTTLSCFCLNQSGHRVSLVFKFSISPNIWHL